MGRAKQLWSARYECEPLSLQQVRRHGLAVVLIESRLVIVQVELRGAARHEQINDVLGLRGEMGQLGNHHPPGVVCRLRKAFRTEQQGQRCPADAESGLPEKVTPRGLLQLLLLSRDFAGSHSLVTVSSAFNKMLATMVQAAISGSSATFLACSRWASNWPACWACH